MGLVDASLAVHLQAYIKGYILHHHLLLDFVVETHWSLPTLVTNSSDNVIISGLVMCTIEGPDV